jgi:hypothetical protein
MRAEARMGGAILAFGPSNRALQLIYDQLKMGLWKQIANQN